VLIEGFLENSPPTPNGKKKSELGKTWFIVQRPVNRVFRMEPTNKKHGFYRFCHTRDSNNGRCRLVGNDNG
ncbi:hypothetical protein Gotri_000445, partial [Gossypium trilobum]|nr:hypothetical protein [Gossypium trilobum]